MLQLTDKTAESKTGVQADIQKRPAGPLEPPTPEVCFQSLVPDYALLFFDHLYSEYLTFKPGIDEPEVIALLEKIHDKRANCQLTWSDIYTFDVALVDVRPLENLIRKAYDARAKYRSIAGQKEYDEYLASKPPDLTTILISPNGESAKPDTRTPEAATKASTFAPSSASPETVEPAEAEAEPSKSVMLIQRVLRADIKYLLSKFYLYYTMLPMRENLREQLTSRAVRVTVIVLGIIVVLIFLSFGGVYVFAKVFQHYGGNLADYGDLSGAFGLTVGSVAFAGIVGGCVSMLQRIQSAPSEGDALFNLASLTNGWRGLSLSPIYGFIFALLLFVLFAAGVLEGSLFPKINTPGKSLPVAPAVKAANESAAASETASSPPMVTSGAAESGSQQPTPSPTPTPTPLTETEKTGILQITDFLKATGPTDGVSFALLIIWSFLAGFLERLVPDTLNRLVAKNQAIQGTNT